jgi:ribosome-associated translation inhibitor RaiA
VSDWKQYQEDAASFFRSIGMDAETDVTIEGVRTTHDVDVLVKSKHVGFEALWIVECKHWSKPVNKLHVLGLRNIVHEVGADKGIMLSESGYQEGAHEAATLTNIQLTSLSELKKTSRQDVFAMRFRDLFDRLAKAEYQYWQYPKQFRKEVGLRPDLAEDAYSSIATIEIAKDILNQSIREAYPIQLGGWAQNFVGQPDQFVSHEEVYNAVDTAISDLERRLLTAQEAWQQLNTGKG